MKHYYLVLDADMPATSGIDPGVEYHFLALGSLGVAGNGKNIVVTREVPPAVPPNWTGFPHLLDGKAITTPALVLALFPQAPATITGFQLAQLVAAQHSAFSP